ncbi:hypothetical protein Pfo_024178 [Paulownia fortunei]|nr:hypothetical protein Pfo_024178 [Paulownia fortunei]
MEGGGERKRKAGPIALDWERLLPSGDNDEEPPSVVVIEEAEGQSKPQVEVMVEAEEEESHRDQYLKYISDKELIEKIARVRKLVQMSSKLSDGGEKLRASLKRQEAELERRKLLKADDKCNKATPLADESTCTGATDGLSPRGAPPSLPASQSTFALHFCSKLDDKRATKSFGEELSTLNRSDHTNMRENGSFATQRTQKIGLSSRQAPFKSPSHLSVHIDDPPQSNGEQSGSHSSTPSPHQSDKDVSGYSAKKENAPRFQPTINSRRNNRKTVVLVDEEELEVDLINQADQMGRSSKDTRIYYPSRDDPEAIEICYSDMECLAPESYLSSTIMNFYIRYLQKPTSPRVGKRCDYHFFNTYFYKKLKRDVLNKIDKETSFVKFRRWWKGVNIFEKAYIFLPIHENLHWSLVIICIPNKEDESGPIILHLDSLGLHISKSIFNDVRSFLIEEWKFLRQEEVLPELPIADNIWDKLSRRIDEKVIEVPQQKNEYDCGLFVLFFMERFIEEAPERLKKKDLEMFGRQWFRPEEASSLRRKISNLLREEFKNANGVTCKLDP